MLPKTKPEERIEKNSNVQYGKFMALAHFQLFGIVEFPHNQPNE